MKKDYKRKLIANTNKYQRKIIWPIIIACLIAGAMAFFSLEYYVASIVNAKMLVFNYDVTSFEWIIPTFLLGVGAILVFIIFWTYFMSNRIVGPFDRITRELDEVVEGKRKAAITTRDGDEMFDQLLKRINSVIERLK